MSRLLDLEKAEIIAWAKIRDNKKKFFISNTSQRSFSSLKERIIF